MARTRAQTSKAAKDAAEDVVAIDDTLGALSVSTTSIKEAASTKSRKLSKAPSSTMAADQPKSKAAKSATGSSNTIDVLSAPIEHWSEQTEHKSSFLDLPHEIRTRIYEFAALSCSELEPIRARNTLDYRISPLPVIHYVKKDKIDNRPTAQRPSKHTLHNLMRLNHHMYIEAKEALYRYVPILVTLGKAGSKQAFEIGRRAVNFQGSDFLSELSCCRTIVLEEGWSQNYKRDKSEQIVEELESFLAWWKDHGGHHIHTCLTVAFSGEAGWLGSDTENTWRSWHSGFPDLLQLLGDFMETLEADMQGRVRLQLRGMAVDAAWGYRPYLPQQILGICRRFPALVDSSIDISDLLKGGAGSG